jgi:hypothetical protein
MDLYQQHILREPGEGEGMQQSSLCGEKVVAGRGFKFEMWVEIEGGKVPIYQITKTLAGIPQGWIKSERGKVSSRPLRVCTFNT